MTPTYLIEIRLARTRWRITETNYAVAHKFGIKKNMERNPHITLYGPLNLNEGVSPGTLISIIGRIARDYDAIPFLMDGLEKREGMHGSVIAFPVTPSEALVTLTKKLAGELSGISKSLNTWDAHPDKKWFHVTVANLLDPGLASEIYTSITSPATGLLREVPEQEGLIPRLRAFLGLRTPKKKPVIPRPLLLDDTGLRITIMQGRQILAEYDLLEKSWIKKEEIHSHDRWQATMAAYRKWAGFEPGVKTPENPDDIFLISDLHLGHANIIHYCSRPFLFTNAGEMDRVLIRNWNMAVSQGSRVFYLGDLRYGHPGPPPSHYLGQLNGNITFIRGNHDDRRLEAIPSTTLEYEGRNFLLIHDPADAPEDFDGWVIHGHYHNNDLRRFPFINPEEKRINVSAEVLGYTPVTIREISRRLDKIGQAESPVPVMVRYPTG